MFKFAITCTSVAALSFLGTLGFAQDAPQLHQGDWPIYNGRDHQPTQDQLNALHLQDVTPNQAREVDRLYDQLETNSSTGAGADRRQPSANDVANDSDETGLAKEIDKENRLLDQELKGVCRGC